MGSKKRVKQLADYQCQICGDKEGKIYPSFKSGEKVKVEAHHIKPKAKGGPTKMSNLIPLCDLCHAVFHPQRYREYFGENGTPENMNWISQQFQDFVKLPPQERERVKRELWKIWGIKEYKSEID